MLYTKNLSMYQPKLLQLVTEPDPRLHQPSDTVKEVTDGIHHLMDDMLFTMYGSGGVGLAAVQIGVHLRVVVIDIDQVNRTTNKKRRTHDGELLHNGEPIHMINPEIVSKSEETIVYCEGCLSFPSITADITRYTSVTVKYLDYYGNEQICDFDGLLSICAQHEIDHTNGIVFLDHLSRLKREYLIKKLIKYKKTLV